MQNLVFRRIFLLLLIVINGLGVYSAQASSLTQSIEIEGYAYQAQLEPSDSVLEKLGPHAALVKGKHYQGVIVEDPDSWVRISEIEGHWDGVAFLFGQIHRIDSGATTGFAPGKLKLRNKVDDAFDHITCGADSSDPLQASSKINPRSIVSPRVSGSYDTLCASQVNGVCMMSELELAFDTQFQQLFPSTFQDKAVAIFNIVEGYYRNQLNIEFDILTMEFLSSNVFTTSTNSNTLLDDVRNKKQSGLSFIKNNIALFHLVTGRDFDGLTAGVAYQGVLCTGFGFSAGTSQYADSNAITAIIIAHELGHNFGAGHDTVDNACGTGFLMEPTVDSSRSSFSACTLAEFKSEIASTSNIEQCFNFPVDFGITADSNNPTSVALNASFDSSYNISYSRAFLAASQVTVSGSINAADGTIVSATLSGKSCTVAGGNLSYSCVASSPTNGLTLVVTATATGSQVRMTHSVAPSSSNDVKDLTPANDSVTATFSISQSGPAQPSSLGVAVSGDDLQLNWTDNATNETGYRVERKLASESSFTTLIDNLAIDSSSHLDTTVTKGETYDYRVVAFNGTGDSAPSNTAQGINEDAPAAPTGLVAAMSDNDVTLSWVDNSSNETAYRVERKMSADANFIALVSLGANSTGYLDTTGVIGVSYDYRVIALNSLESTPSNTAQITVTPQNPPSTPTNLVATPSSSGINLNWNDTATNESGYRIERQSSAGFSTLANSASNSTSYFDAAAVAGVSYTYRVFAVNVAGDSAASNTATASRQAPPTAPSNLTAITTGTTGTTIQLSWSDNASNETGYRIERKSPQTNFNIIASVSANATSYSEQGADGVTYIYRVFAMMGSTLSSASNEAQVTVQEIVATPPAPETPEETPTTPEPSEPTEPEIPAPSTPEPETPTTPEEPNTDDPIVVALPTQPSHLVIEQRTEGIFLSWRDNATNESGYNIERQLDGARAFVVIASNLPAGTTEYLDESAQQDSVYSYRVVAFNESGQSAPSSDEAIEVIPVPLAPGSLVAAQVGSDVSLGWIDNAADEDGYIVQRKLKTSTQWQTISTQAANVDSFEDRNVGLGQTYQYQVFAFVGSLNSTVSNTAEVTLSEDSSDTVSEGGGSSSSGGSVDWLFVLLALVVFGTRMKSGNAVVVIARCDG